MKKIILARKKAVNIYLILDDFSFDSSNSNNNKIQNNSPKKIYNSEYKHNTDLTELKSYKKITNNQIIINENEIIEKSFINEIREYSNLKQNFLELGIDNHYIFKKNFPIVILNPGYDEINQHLTEKISIGSIID